MPFGGPRVEDAANYACPSGGATAPLFTWGEAQFLLETTSVSAVQDTDVSIEVTTLKRARRREIERLSRLRRQLSLEAMRCKVQVLERRVREMLETDAGKKRPIRAKTSRTIHSIRRKCIQLIADALSLENENELLASRLHSNQLLSQSIEFLASTFAEHWEDCSSHNELHRSYTPWRHADLFVFMRETLELVTANSARKDWVSSGKSYMEWEDRRHIDSGDVFFTFTKRFPGRDPERVMLDSWELFTQEALFKDTMMPSNSCVTLLEVPNEDVMVVHRQTKFMHANTSSHTVYILFRLRTEDGFSICFRTIPILSFKDALGDNDTWFDTFHWTHLNYTKDAGTGDPSGCEVIFGGRLIDTIERYLVGSFATIARWENAAIAPMFRLG